MYPQSKDSPKRSQLPSLLFQSPKGLDSLLEQLHQGDCPHPHLPFLMATNADKKRTVLFTPRCKLWRCPVCGPLNVQLAAWRASDGARTLFQEHGSIGFATVTPHERVTPQQSWWILPKGWKKLRQRMNRAAGHEVQYYCVPELHGNGKVHLHMLTTAKLSKKWWKDNARACGFGYQNDAQEVVAIGGVTAYVTKYLTKTLENSELPSGTRRFRASHGWPKLPEMEAPDGWKFETVKTKEPLSDIVETAHALGYSVAFAGSKSAWKLVSAE